MKGDNRQEWAESPWKRIRLKAGAMRPRYNLGVSLLSDGTILIIGGDSIHNVSCDIRLFDPKRRIIKYKALGNETKIVPAYYPCVEIQRHLVVTIDSSTQKIATYDTQQQLVRTYDPIYLLNSSPANK